ncbi:Tryptophan synthase alpha chain [Labilithrix luteola]|uniref:Tryptophan synthase alpha chain n=1 Tax=Labilithrix luteola TaxID=1391654 RepID=A0A0K1Q3A4_9BACT|nr:Tryptophan synthase alpha chain [Labilithrix luteola]
MLGAASAITLSAFGCGSSTPKNTLDDGGTASDGNDGGTSTTTDPTSGTGDSGTGDSGTGDSGTPCKGLQCQQVTCGGGGDTTVTGTVFTPSGTIPIYNAIVYVPNADPVPLTKGATCDRCGAVTGEPVVTALSAANGQFILKNVPAGKNIPLVIQVGKWRRQVTIPEVTACSETKLADPELTRLPKNQSEGSMPQIALTTGACDKLGCMLPKIGIDASEFGVESDGTAKAVHVYKGADNGGPTAASQASAFWSDATKMMKYDMILLSCECTESLNNKGGADGPAFTAMADYLKAGGRIFTTDFMYAWYRYSGDPDLRSATDIRGGAPQAGSPMTVNASFPKGQALSDWLSVVIPGSAGTASAEVVFGNIKSVDETKTQLWATSGAMNRLPEGPRIFSANLPVGVSADKQCGKAVHIDAHVNSGLLDAVDKDYPASCKDVMKPSENLLAFFFFDLASCIQDDGEPPTPPPVK